MIAKDVSSTAPVRVVMTVNVGGSLMEKGAKAVATNETGDPPEYPLHPMLVSPAVPNSLKLAAAEEDVSAESHISVCPTSGVADVAAPMPNTSKMKALSVSVVTAALIGELPTGCAALPRASGPFCLAL